MFESVVTLKVKISGNSVAKALFCVNWDMSGTRAKIPGHWLSEDLKPMTTTLLLNFTLTKKGLVVLNQ